MTLTFVVVIVVAIVVTTVMAVAVAVAIVIAAVDASMAAAGLVLWFLPRAHGCGCGLWPLMREEQLLGG